jgi:hypothetical protein
MASAVRAYLFSQFNAYNQRRYSLKYTSAILGRDFIIPFLLTSYQPILRGKEINHCFTDLPFSRIPPISRIKLLCEEGFENGKTFLRIDDTNRALISQSISRIP